MYLLKCGFVSLNLLSVFIVDLLQVGSVNTAGSVYFPCVF